MKRGIMLLLAVAGILVGCGGGDDKDDDEQSASATEATSTTTTVASTTTTAEPLIVYEVDGAGTAIINYATAANPNQNREITLPWSEEQVDEPASLQMLVTLTGTQGDVTCQIRRGDQVLDEQTLASGAGPFVSCSDPPSGEPPVTYPSG